MSAKIRDIHLQRKAAVYLRQSTPRQVMANHESTLRQYDLKTRAIKLGWPERAVEVIDQDLGQSGASTQGRQGFVYLSEQVSQGRVGAILVLEVSRLSRSSADWHQLLELCAVADVVIVDEQAVYHPNDSDDRLLLGLKGAFSEAEREWMRRRMQGARQAKAQRGQLYMRPPLGYVWDEVAERFALDADQQVQALVRYVFGLFERIKSAGAVARQLHEEKVLLCHRDQLTGELVFSQASSGRVISMVRNPAYAGAYVWGRTEWVQQIVDHKIEKRRCLVPVDQWKVVYRDHHPAYISWETYMANRDQLRQNDNHPRSSSRSQSAPRRGGGLLQGIVLCGHCGRQMCTVYMGQPARPYYKCAAGRTQGCAALRSWSVSAPLVDEPVERLFLEALGPQEIELCQQVAAQAAKQAAELDTQWQMRLERASYETRLAERRYKAVDPEMRLVARTLEEQWEEKLRAQRNLELDYEEQLRRKWVGLSDQDQRRLAELSKDVEKVWRAETTTMEQRKNLVRVLVEQVALRREAAEVEVALMWASGAAQRVMVERRQPGPHRLDSATSNLIRQLVADGLQSAQIVEHLNTAGRLTARQNKWTVPRLNDWCMRNQVRRRGRRSDQPTLE